MVVVTAFGRVNEQRYRNEAKNGEAATTAEDPRKRVFLRGGGEPVQRPATLVVVAARVRLGD